MADDKKTTDFGFTRVPIAEKADRVREVFQSVAGRYDVMNDLMSLGTHRIMKQMTVEATRARSGHRILDLAGGTGDLTIPLSKIVGDTGHVVLCDINDEMIMQGRDKLINKGIISNVSYILADGEQLPFGDETFDSVTIAFGLRNFTDKEAALSSMLRVLKPGGRIAILEFSQVENTAARQLYDRFSSLWPKIGKAVTGDEASYHYLVESIRMHPDQETLAEMMGDAGFTRVRFDNLLGGVTAIHEGMRPRS